MKQTAAESRSSARERTATWLGLGSGLVLGLGLGVGLELGLGLGLGLEGLRPDHVGHARLDEGGGGGLRVACTHEDETQPL